MDLLDKVLTEIKNLSSKHNIDMTVNIFKGKELWSEGEDEKRNSNWSLFEEKAGVYCFISKTKDSIKYIGESSVNVGNRLNNWFLNPKKEKEIEISKNLEDEDYIIIFTIDKQKYMARAVEAFLLSIFDTEFNVKK